MIKDLDLPFVGPSDEVQRISSKFFLDQRNGRLFEINWDDSEEDICGECGKPRSSHIDSHNFNVWFDLIDLDSYGFYPFASIFMSQSYMDSLEDFRNRNKVR